MDISSRNIDYFITINDFNEVHIDLLVDSLIKKPSYIIQDDVIDKDNLASLMRVSVKKQVPSLVTVQRLSNALEIVSCNDIQYIENHGIIAILLDDLNNFKKITTIYYISYGPLEETDIYFYPLFNLSDNGKLIGTPELLKFKDKHLK